MELLEPMRPDETTVEADAGVGFASLPADAPLSAPIVGAALIAAEARRLPNAPGVYRMLDRAGTVLYVGKARSLKKRVASYTKTGGHSNRIALMISLTAAMEFVSTGTETEALLLEANLIKQLKPRFNILLRDDKSFPYILIRTDHPAPQILKHRGARGEKGHYFGPFASAGAVGRTLNTLERAFLLRSCRDSVYASRSRPCLLHQIKRCSAPCTGEIDLESYHRLVEEAVLFLSGENIRAQTELSKQMQVAAEALDFESAAALRDRIRALTYVQGHQAINPSTVDEADVIAATEEAGQIAIQVFFFRSGQNWGNRAYYPRHDKSEEIGTVVEAFIGQFYDDKPVPKLLLLSHETPERALLAEALSLKSDRRIEIEVPKRGEKRELVDHALANAREALGRRLAETASQAKLLAGVGDAFGLAALPQRIEVFDNSHIQGTNAVGAMIVAGPEGFQKGQYRKFNIKSETLTPGDDFGMMREVLRRRLKRLAKETAEGTAEAGETVVRPDLILVDGGLGQLSAALEVLADSGVTGLTIAGIAKGENRNAGEETLYLPGRPPFKLPARSPVLYYLQRLRDEAHRFAIGAHREKRAKAVGVTALDEIDGIGATRKRALLHHFGSARAVSRAGLTDLEKVPGVSRALAKRIYDFFRSGG